jgi:hypothetical protein
MKMIVMGSEPRQALSLFIRCHLVCVCVCVRWLRWTQEHKDHREDAHCILVQAIRALYLATDDPYTQEHSISRELQ